MDNDTKIKFKYFKNSLIRELELIISLYSFLVIMNYCYG
jgi:hypothetical protein